MQIIVFGRSLGGAVAFWVAAANPGAVNSLIVENTFWSIEAVTGKENGPITNICISTAEFGVHSISVQSDSL